MAVLLVFAVGANAVAFMQARRMTHFVDGGRRTAPPERLSAVEAAVVVLTGVTVPRPLNRRTPAQLGLMYRTHRFPSGHGPELEAWEVPGKAEQLWSHLGQPGRAAAIQWRLLGAPPVDGTTATKPEGLFPKPAPPAA